MQRNSVVLAVFFLALSATAWPTSRRHNAHENIVPEEPIPFESIDWSQHGFEAAKEDDHRSPCPGLNTLANHGFLPRNGKGLTIQNVVTAGLDIYNVHPDVIGLAAKIGLTATASLDGTFTLNDIRLHNSIEHDASVSRGDLDVTGDNFSFNETIYTALAQSNPGVDYYNTTSAGQVQKQRLIESKLENPNGVNTAKQIGIRTRESSLYLSVMGDPVTGVAPKKFVDIFFREERLPLEEGWTRSKAMLNVTNVNALDDQIFESSEWVPDEGVCASIVLILAPGSYFEI